MTTKEEIYNSEFGLSERTQLELLLRLRKWEAEHDI